MDTTVDTAAPVAAAAAAAAAAVAHDVVFHGLSLSYYTMTVLTVSVFSILLRARIPTSKAQFSAMNASDHCTASRNDAAARH